MASLLGACRESEESGARRLWSVAAPRFRRGIDGPSHLSQLLRNDLYRPLTEWRSYEAHPAERKDASARQLVVLELPSGERAAYLFALVIPGGSAEPGWLLTGIERQ